MIPDCNAPLPENLVDRCIRQTVSATEDEERLRRVIMHMPVLIVAIGEDDGVQVWNHRCEEVTGYPASEMIGRRDALTLLVPSARHRRSKALRHQKKPIARFNWEVDIVRRDGRRRTLSVANLSRRCPIPGWRAWAVAVDVTARRRAEEINQVLFEISNAVTSTESPGALYRSIHDTLDRIIDTTNFYICICHPEGHTPKFPYLVDIHEGTDEMFDLENAGLLTADVLRDGKPMILTEAQMRERTARAGRSVIGVLSKSWLGVPLAVKGQVIGAMVIQSYSDPQAFTEDDVAVLQSVAGHVAIAIDHKRTAEALVRSHEDLERCVDERTRALQAANAQLKTEMDERGLLQDRLIQSERLAATGQLAASIAHEINSPLQGMRSLIAATRRSRGDGETLEKHLALVEEGIDRIRDTVQNLLDLNRPGNERKQPMCINRIIRSTVSLVQSHLKQHRVRIDLDLAEKMPVLKASPQQFGQVFMNLINNALESMVEAAGATTSVPGRGMVGTLLIRTRYHGDAVTVTVADSGPGIRPEDMDHIFDPFYTRKKRKGMGVGLSICYGVIEDHNGTISAANAPEGGAVFTITLPCAARSIG